MYSIESIGDGYKGALVLHCLAPSHAFCTSSESVKLYTKYSVLCTATPSYMMHIGASHFWFEWFACLMKLGGKDCS